MLRRRRQGGGWYGAGGWGVALVVFAILAQLWCRPASADQKKVALVVGNGAYQHLAHLQNPPNDATLIAATLRSLGFTLIGDGAQTDLDKTAFEHAIRNFGAALAGGSVGLFYYAGHGLQLDGINYLVPVSANPVTAADADFELIDADIVLKQMAAAGSQLNIVILDACRNNPFGGRGLRDAGGGLAVMRAPRGTLISYATQPGSVARDGSNGHSPYTAALAEAIRRPGLGVLDVFNAVGLAVDKATGGQQEPWVSSSPIEGAFHFASAPAAAASSNPAPAAAPPAATAPPVAVAAAPSAARTLPDDAELVFWQSITSSSNPADFNEYLRQYPSGRFVGLARNRLATLQTAASSPQPVQTPTRQEPPGQAPLGQTQSGQMQTATATTRAPMAPVQPAPQAPPQDAVCADASNDAILRPVFALYDAIRRRDIAAYAAEWADDAVFQSADGRIERNRQTQIAVKRLAFLRWRQVDAQIQTFRIGAKNANTARVFDTYSMSVQLLNGRQVRDQHVREWYEVRCQPGGWKITRNVDYAP